MLLRKIQKNRFSIIAFLSVFLMIYVSNETIMFGTNANESYSLIGYAITLMLTFYWCGKSFIGKKQGKAFVLCLVLLCLNIITMFLNFDFSIKYCYVCVIVLLAYCFSYNVSFDLFTKIYRSIIFLIAGAALLAWVIQLFAKPVLYLFPVITNESDFRFYNLLFSMVMQGQDGLFYRSFGIFREPGVFAVYLLLALVFEMLDRNKTPRLLNCLVYILAILTTYSTAGYIIVLILLLTFLVGNKVTKNIGSKILVLFLIVLLLSMFFNNESILNSVFLKLFVKNSSVDSRVGAVGTNISIALRDILHFLIGSGFTYVETNFSDIAANLGYLDAHNTNTTLKIFSVYGITYFAVICYSLFKFSIKLTRNFAAIIAVTVSFILMFSNEDFIVNVILYLLVFYAYKRRFKKPVLIKRKFEENPLD